MTRRSLLLGVLLFVPCLYATALEIGGSYRIENMAFHRDRLETDTAFSGLDFLMGFSLDLTQPLEENLTFEFDYIYDAVLRNLSTSLLLYKGNYYSFGVGPFLGFFNTSGNYIPRVGIASLFKVEWPGLVFAELWLDNSTNNQLVKAGDYIQQRQNLSVGFHVPNAIVSINILTRRFIERKAVSATDVASDIVDTITEYSLSTDLFKKNVPYKIVITFALRSLSKAFIEGAATTATHSLHSLIVGSQFEMDITRAIRLNLDLESSIYTFGQDALLGISNPGPGGYLFRLITSFSLDFDKF
jgi:hypothetical protein